MGAHVGIGKLHGLARIGDARAAALVFDPVQHSRLSQKLAALSADSAREGASAVELDDLRRDLDTGREALRVAAQAPTLAAVAPAAVVPEVSSKAGRPPALPDMGDAFALPAVMAGAFTIRPPPDPAGPEHSLRKASSTPPVRDPARAPPL